jgi:chromosome segregation ATPase
MITRLNAGEPNMSTHIDHFCDNLRAKLTNVETDMKSLKAKIESSAATAELEVRKALDATKRQIEQQRGKLEGAQGDLKKWALERKAVSDEMVAAWKDKLETARLQSRADKAERYATAAAALAAAAVDEAEQAVLEAWLARRDAETAQSTKAA